MPKQMDGRARRGAVRRYVYGEVASLMALERAVAPDVATTPTLAALYYDERRALLEWLRARARGQLRSPPGGVRVGR